MLARTLAPPAFGEVHTRLRRNAARQLWPDGVDHPTAQRNGCDAHGARVSGDFTLSLFGAQIALSAALGVSAALIALAVAQSSLPKRTPRHWSRIARATAVAAPGVRAPRLYTEGRQPASLANDLVAYGGMTAGVTALTIAGTLSPARALLILALDILSPLWQWVSIRSDGASWTRICGVLP